LQKKLKLIITTARFESLNLSGAVMKKFSLYLKIFPGVIIAGLLCWLYFGNYLEMEKPEIKLSREISPVGKQKIVEIIFFDKKSGLSNLKAEIIQDNKNRIITEEKIAAKGIKQKILSLTIDTAALNLNDGSATINIAATDYSLFKNQIILSQPVMIDTKPPQIILPSAGNYFNQGGTGFIAYRVSKPAEATGIYINDHFTAGHSLTKDNRASFVAYFAVPLFASNQKTKIIVFARDEAGNEAKIVLPCIIQEKKFRSDKLNLSESFLQQKMPEFQSTYPQLQGKTIMEVFDYVNSQMREDNDKAIQTICQKSAGKKLWEGAFLRMRNAATMASFGDKRTYVIGGKEYGSSIHSGVDLASTAHAAIYAANNGIVVFAGPLGIYGNTVIIDHGLGLLSLYAHLSSIETTSGKNVKKEELIGHSGTTGLAGGDHLHFGILADGQFVNPLEWWDPHWIEDNINKKMRL
jgi:murein DD-endopeptidase MepM/ murein hydrolase activator NlpD